MNKDDTIYIVQLKDGWAKFYYDGIAAYVDEQELTKETRDISELDENEHIVEVLSIVYPQHEIRAEDVEEWYTKYDVDWYHKVTLDTLIFKVSDTDGYVFYYCKCLLEPTEENRQLFLDECYYPLCATFPTMPDEDRRDIIDRLKAGEERVEKVIEKTGLFWMKYDKPYYFSTGLVDNRFQFYMSDED